MNPMVEIMALSILFVDDEETMLTLYKRAFKDTDYSLYTAKNGFEALGQVQVHRPELVFLDVVMPKLSGYEVMPLIHEMDPSISVIMVSGRISEVKAKELLAHGAFDFIQKPFDLTHLLNVFEQWRIGNEFA